MLSCNNCHITLTAVMTFGIHMIIITIYRITLLKAQIIAHAVCLCIYSLVVNGCSGFKQKQSIWYHSVAPQFKGKSKQSEKAVFFSSSPDNFHSSAHWVCDSGDPLPLTLCRLIAVRLCARDTASLRATHTAGLIPSHLGCQAETAGVGRRCTEANFSVSRVAVI